jgi:hypothetical protein
MPTLAINSQQSAVSKLTHSFLEALVLKNNGLKIAVLNDLRPQNLRYRRPCLGGAKFQEQEEKMEERKLLEVIRKLLASQDAKPEELLPVDLLLIIRLLLR